MPHRLSRNADATRFTSALPALAELAAIEWDRGNEYFSPTSFQISHVQAGTGANNMIPGRDRRAVQLPLLDRVDRRAAEGARARGARRARRRLRADVDAVGAAVPLAARAASSTCSATRSRPSPASRRRSRRAAARPTAASSPRVSREVVEFGPVSASIHAIDEHVRLADIAPLSAVYEQPSPIARLSRSSFAPAHSRSAFFDLFVTVVFVLRGDTIGRRPMQILLLSMPDSFEHTPTIAVRMPNGALASLAANVDPHHHVAVADLVLAQSSVRRHGRAPGPRPRSPDVVGLSVMTFQRSTARRIISLIRSMQAGRPHRRRRLRPEPGARGVDAPATSAWTSSSAAKAT